MAIQVTVSFCPFAACEKLVTSQQCSHIWYLVKTEGSCSSKYQVLLLETHTFPALAVFLTGKCNKIDVGRAVAASSRSSIIIPGHWLGKVASCSHADM